MKKTFFILLLTVFILLSACNRQVEPRELFSLPLTLKASLSPNGEEFTAVIGRDCCDVYFEDSHALAGTHLYLSEDKNTAEIEGYFEREVKKGTFPAQEALYKSVILLATSGQIGEKYENGAKYTIDEMTIMVYYDKDTERVTHIETEENGRRFLFAVTSLVSNEAQSNGAGQP